MNANCYKTVFSKRLGALVVDAYRKTKVVLGCRQDKVRDIACDALVSQPESSANNSLLKWMPNRPKARLR